MSNARQILIVDDDEDLRDSLRDQLALYDEFQVTTAATAASICMKYQTDTASNCGYFLPLPKVIKPALDSFNAMPTSIS